MIDHHARRRTLRRAALAGGAAALTAAVALAQPATAAAAAVSAAPAAETPIGLFGRSDPTYDGVLRQSIALLAQDAAGFEPGTPAVDWLLGQQCADGSFLSFRADPQEPCPDVTAADSNATALATQALAALGGHEEQVSAALDWLAGVQNADGGWSFNPGGPSDANSTAVVASAFSAAGQDPAEVRREGNSPFDALSALQLGCDAPEGERGAFAWQPDPESGELSANDAATVDAVLASAGSGLLVDPDATPAVAPTAEPCGVGDEGEDPEGTEETEQEEEPAGQETGEAAATDGASGEEPQAPQTPQLASGAAGAARLTAALDDNGQYLAAPATGTDPGEGEDRLPDFGNTAKAVIALAALGDDAALAGPLGWLSEHHTEWPDHTQSPAALGLLVLAAHAGGASPTDFGGSNLVDALNALGPAPGDGSAGDGDDSADDDSGGGLGAVLWVIALGLLAGIGIGVLLSVRRARARETDAAFGPAEGGEGGKAEETEEKPASATERKAEDDDAKPADEKDGKDGNDTA
ncbi:prenyltransferase/squalene oxidase repeat-containing protein [Streptomyces millisiae]|uniref:Prenyltransferase/squalene oxidase repeat-containing protein n=1 Tax=Streptomyces millisiae TaxID=3075542 RepID=A0ABU2LZR1_9ACTN|nr:prenyltransferase/squalene oxidase repeat-containing protein [Streptomyces sp. DSM 44918]MDT0323069.1 prenyltransferase/squalene oxidase repeat-containing protein [Streptomyces sp. DSM 44918]